MVLSHTSWSNPLLVNHSTTSSKLHSVGCVFFNCEGEVVNAGSCGGVYIAGGVCAVAAGADIAETILGYSECTLFKCDDDAEGNGRPLAIGVLRTGTLVCFVSGVGAGRMTVDEAVLAGVAYEFFPDDGDLCSDTSSGLTAGGGGEKVGKVKLADDARMALESVQKLVEMISEKELQNFPIDVELSDESDAEGDADFT